MIIKALCEVAIGLLRGIRRACLVLMVELRKIKKLR